MSTVWDMLTDGEVSTADFVRCATQALLHESDDSVVEPVLSLAVRAGELWSPESLRDELLSSIAEVCIRLSSDPTREVVGLRGLARTATTPEQLAELARRAVTPDIQWRRLARLAEQGRVDLAEVDALEQSDPNPDAWVEALSVRAARPDEEAKQTAWPTIVMDRRVPAGMVRRAGAAFWRPSQGEVLRPFADAYIEELPTMHEGGMLWAMALSRSMFPTVGVDIAGVDRLEQAAAQPGIGALVSKNVRERVDELHRMLRAREG